MLPQRDAEADMAWMREALREAEKAYRIGEVPVGAVVVFDGRVIGRGHNQVELLQDATAHAEMLAIGSAAQYLASWRLSDCTLYTTLEPCCMCAGAVLLSRVERVVWSAPDVRHGAHGSFVDLFSQKHPTHQCLIQGHLLEEVSSDLMKRFFREQRTAKS